MRVFSKGSGLPYVHKSSGWNEHANFKDYDVVFVNLLNLENKSQNYDHPYNGSENIPKLLDSSDVSKFIRTGGYMIVYLPKHPTVEMGETTTKPKKTAGGSQQPAPRGGSMSKKDNTEPYSEYNLLDWLPFSAKFNTDESGESIEVFKNDWKWYFGDSFKWEYMISGFSGQFFDYKTIAKNSYDEDISIEVTRGNDGGYAALVPPNSNYLYSEFVKSVLQNVFDIESGVRGRAPPSWLSDYSLPTEENIQQEIDEKRSEVNRLEKEIENITQFKQLLYEADTRLEETVQNALRQIGFDVSGEIPGKRDGVLHSNKTDFVLEITGTTGGIKLSKCRQLDEWVDNAVAESPQQSVSGLLIVNSEMSTAPGDRNLAVEPNVQKYMDKRGDYKILTTIDLYKLVKLEIEEEIGRKVLKQMLSQKDTLLTLPQQ